MVLSPLRIREEEEGCWVECVVRGDSFLHLERKLLSSQLVPDDLGSFASMVGVGVFFQQWVRCCSRCFRETSCSVYTKPAERSPALTGRVEVQRRCATCQSTQPRAFTCIVT